MCAFVCVCQKRQRKKKKKPTVIHQGGHFASGDVIKPSDVEAEILKPLFQAFGIHVASLPGLLLGLAVKILVVDQQKETSPLEVKVVLVRLRRRSRTHLLPLTAGKTNQSDERKVYIQEQQQQK